MEHLDAGARAATWLTHGEQSTTAPCPRAHRARRHPTGPESQQRARELSAPTSTMTRALLAIDAASCVHHDGHTQEACQRTVAVLSDLPAAYRCGLVRRRALDLYHRTPAHHHQETDARALREALAA
ncbi:hypothetical protein [Streptomyces echinatus]|uniref:Uncharacterized protein n=1 Tax=Streptomyces echinatus TaxID=67293 RepID=A0A7W9Q315_9ACTN|nr:hypothetical protein [Streptomyces echinatus]MBB5932203.1 hypothetical protein [Streptomyces echinatus]